MDDTTNTEEGMRIILTLEPGRDDAALRALRLVPKRARAEECRRQLWRIWRGGAEQAAGSGGERGQVDEAGGKQAWKAPAVKQPSQPLEPAKSEGLNLSGVDSLPMDLDFSGLGRS